MEQDTYCYELRDGDEVVRYGFTKHLRYTEHHYKRRRERKWIKYTEFIPDKEPRNREDAKKEKRNRIKTYEETYGKKPRYNKNYWIKNGMFFYI